MLSSQLLCRLSLQSKEGLDGTQAQIDFWRILGIEDEFDKSYIIAQVERFNLLYNVRGSAIEDDAGGLFAADYVATDPTAGLNVSPGGFALPPYMDQTATAVAAAAVAAADMHKYGTVKKLSPESAKLLGKDSEADRKQSYKAEQRRITQERKEQRQRDKELLQLRKAQERAAREQSREERRRKKVEIREQRETFAKEQKKAALRRAEELVKSNRVPIEITRGAAAAKAAANAALVAGGASVSSGDESQPAGMKKPRSAIVVSTAGDLHMICTHAKNLWAKYNAIAKEHNQKVNWITVAKELGIHVKVREKYSRMHARAESRGFDWEKNAHLKIKDHPEIFLEPTPQERKSKMPSTVNVDANGRSTVLIDGSKEVADEAVAAAAAVVDASVNSPPVDAVVQTTEEQTAAAAAVAAASLVADPTAGLTGPVDV
eukprot:scaffold486_cov152-Amphora_coffeaeformis.AAC.1